MVNAIDITELPEATDEVDLGTSDEPAETVFVYDEHALNLVPEFESHPDGEKELKELSRHVYSTFKTAFDESEEYRKRCAADWKIFTGDLPPKEAPWKDCANAHIPIMMENLTRLHARMYGELFGDWQNVFGVQSLGPDDDVVSKALSVHGNWQLRNTIPGFKRQMDRALLAFLIYGDVAIRSYFDDLRKCNIHEVLTPDTFITPFHYTSVNADYSDLPWYACVLHRQKYELEAMRDKWSGVDDVLDGKEPSCLDEPEELMTEEASTVQGVGQDDGTKSAPYKLIHWEGYYTLPNQDKQRFIQVILDYASQAVLFFTIHEEGDWRDQKRFNGQKKELEQYNQAIQQHQQLQLQIAQQTEQVASAFEVGQMDAATADQGIQQMQQSLPPAPVPPAWTEGGAKTEPDAVRMVPIRLFTHIVCIEPLVGNIGLGYGRIQADFTRAANVAQSQFIDACSLANSSSMCIAYGVEFEGGNPKVYPGAILRAKSITGTELKNSIVPFDFKPGNPQLLTIVDKMYGYGQSSIQAPNVLSGEPGKSGETYRGLSARIEQATKQISVVTRKFGDGVEEVLKRNAALNAQFLPDDELFEIQNHDQEVLALVQQFITEPAANDGGSVMMRVSREMYQRDYRVEIRADLRFATQAQRIGEADELVQMAQNPMLQQNLAFQYAALKQSLKARGLDQMIPLLGAPPPTPKMFGEQMIQQMAQQMAQQQIQQMQQQQGGQGGPPGAPPGAPPQQGAA